MSEYTINNILIMYRPNNKQALFKKATILLQEYLLHASARDSSQPLPYATLQASCRCRSMP